MSAAPLAYAAMTPRYRHYALFVFWLASMVSFLDRHIMSVLLEPIKADLHFSDTELGLLGGLAFSVFYVVFGFPIARLVERFNRRNILALSVLAWSAMASLCGMATGFMSFFFARSGVAIGEAGGAPAIQSLVADHFPPERRGAAFAVLGTAITASIMTAYLFGGWLSQAVGWRWTFVIMGAPGLVLALLIRATLAEPERGASENRAASAATPPFLETIRTLWSRAAYRNAALGGAAAGMAAWGSGVWLTSFLVRVHGLTVAEAGAALGLIFGVVGTIGTLAGGVAVDRLVARSGDTGWYMRLSAIGMIAAAPLAATAYLAPSLTMMLVMLTVTIFAAHLYSGPVTAMVQGLAKLRMRGTATAFYSLINGLVAMGLGPLLVGGASDLFGTEYGSEALRYALVTVVCSAYAVAALFFWFSSRTLRADLLEAAQ